MVENRWQMIVGGAVLLLMLLVGTFSLGVYIGRHGLNQADLRYDPVQPVKQPPNPGLTGNPIGPITQPDLIGLVRQVNHDRFDIATREGPRSVTITSETQLFTSQAVAIPLSNLKPGDLIALYGEIQNVDGNQFLAVRILLLPEDTHGPP